MMLRRLTGMAAAVLCCWGQAFATDFVDGPYNFNYGPNPQQQDPKGVQVTLPKFNNQGGTRLLKRVDIEVNVAAFMSISIENNLAGARNSTPSVTANATVDFPAGLFADSDNFLISLNQVMLAGTDQQPCTGSDFFDYGDRDAGPIQFTHSFVGDPTSLAGFIGAGQLAGQATMSIVGSAGGAAFAFNLEGPRNGGAACTNTSPLIQVTANVTYFYADAPGACCLPNGTCTDLTQDNCTTAGGTFTAGTTCATQPADYCARACCLPNGTCINTTQANCTSQSGSYNSGNRCETLPSDFCARSCCLPNGTCVNTTQASCTSQGGSYSSASRCADLAADTCFRACCMTNGTCINTTQANCTSQSGSYSSGNRCETLPSEFCLRACCLADGMCINTTQASCESQSGSYNSGSRCEDLPAGFCSNDCDCYWLNGEPDNRNAIVSETNVTVPPSESADDFIIPMGKALLATQFCGCLITNDLERVSGNLIDRPDATLAIYDDCNGKPGQLLAFYNEPDYEIMGNAPFGSPGQYRFVEFCFDLDGLRLEAIGSERRLWVSLVGVGDNTAGERYFWATSKTVDESDVQGVQAQLKSAWIEGFIDWRNVDETNGGCHDLCFQLCGDLCDVICDNTPYATDCGLKMLNTTFFGTKAADNFQILPCKDVDVCLIQTWIATNCTPTRSRIEVRSNECDLPTSPPAVFETAPMLNVIPAVTMGGTPITFMSPVSGLALTVYCLEWKFVPGSLELVGGQNYWLSVFLNGTGVITEEAYFLCRPLDECSSIKITEAQFISSPFDVNEWEPISNLIGTPRDLAFRVLGTVNDQVVPQPVRAAPTNVVNTGATQQTPPTRDLNGDGVIDIQDIQKVLELMSSSSAR